MSEKEPLIPVEPSKISEIVDFVKGLLAKEFLALLIILVIAFPLALGIGYVMTFFFENSTTKNLVCAECVVEPKQEQLPFIFLYMIAIAGLYFARLVAGAIKTVTNSDSE
ncbi:MAG: hypothetical protein ACI837_003016 [Crocinitomicaceae bacterium]|jgi:hypothetical protein